MSRRHSSLRRRLAVCLVGMAVGSLVLAVLVTAGLARSAALSDAKRDLRDAAQGVERLAGAESLTRLSRQLSRVLDVDEVGVVAVRPDGSIGPVAQGRLPSGVDAGMLDGARLAAGQTQTGTDGRLAFVAHPVARTQTPRGGLLGGQTVVLMTREVAVFPLGRTGASLLGAGILVAAIAAAVALWLARRLTRPIDAMQAAAMALAGGDLSARVNATGAANDELAALARTIDAMAADLERAKQSERAFLMSVSHDLRTPLTSIRGYAEAIADGAAEGEEARRRAAAVIAAEAVRLERLVADLLDLARLDTRAFTLHHQEVDAATVVTRTVEGFLPAATEAAVDLHCHRPAGPVRAVTDPERLAQVVANLTENALKYAAGAVEVSVSVSGGVMTIDVVDDGPGIDPADLPHVFDRLYASRRSPGRKVGTGLGLAIVRELTAAMGGRVEAAAGPAGGTRIRVTLPAAPTASSSSPTGPGSSSWSASASSSS